MTNVLICLKVFRHFMERWPLSGWLFIWQTSPCAFSWDTRMMPVSVPSFLPHPTICHFPPSDRRPGHLSASAQCVNPPYRWTHQSRESLISYLMPPELFCYVMVNSSLALALHPSFNYFWKKSGTVFFIILCLPSLYMYLCSNMQKYSF